MSDLIKSIKCSNCGGDIKLDFDNLISYCPYCASALSVDISTIKDVLIEKEKTKQILGEKDIELQAAKMEAKHELKTLLLMMIFFLVIGAFIAGFTFIANKYGW